MTGFPAFEFARLVFLAGVAQFRDDFGILRREPVLKFVERFHRRKHRHGNFNGVRCHAIKLSAIGGKASASCVSNLTAKFPINKIGKRIVCRNELPDYFFF